MMPIPGNTTPGRLARLMWLIGGAGLLCAAPHAFSRPRIALAAKGCECANTSLVSALERVGGAEDPPRAHDPTMAYEHGKYYMYTTGPGIPFSVSTDLRHWKASGKALPAPFKWTSEAVSGSSDIYWAPHVVKYLDKWLMFYAVSTFGKNLSVIGVATNTTLNPESKEYAWKDAGAVVATHPGDTWNAIDPNFVVDAKGQPWLAAGSFWSGLKLIQLDPATLHQTEGMSPAPIAGRPHTPDIRGAIEAPCMVQHGGYWYLFASFDFCCRGISSTYNVRVGRSKDIRGPYKDRAGVSMLEGGGTQVLAATERWKGPGHNGYLKVGKRELLAYHAYDATDNGMPKLQIADLTWDKDGWPRVTSTNGDIR